MEPITPRQVQQILAVTDRLGLHREAVVIPLGREGAGGLVVTPRRKLEITAPEGPGFEEWLARLPDQVARLDLAGVLRADDD